jgi:16S rRNA (guanine527-N7)-methyltransferase
MTTDADARLRTFAALLLRWNTTLNLVAPRDIDVLWDRHIADSLQLVPLMPTGVTRGIDLGTGGGFPGLVLAIATGVPFDLIESDHRKASFLRTAILETKAPATVHCCRIEQATVPPASLVTARALAPLPRLLPMAARLLTEGGTCLLLKGARAQEELEAAERDWTMTVERAQSRTSADGVVLRLTGVRARH